MTEDERMILLVDMSDALDKLAARGTPDQIRDYLVREGLVGHRGVATACPVQRYLTRMVGAPNADCRYSVRTDVVWVIEENCAALNVPNPLVVEEFIHRFDRCYYPELEVTNDGGTHRERAE